jgi:PAS domain S-box-containing protein
VRDTRAGWPLRALFLLCAAAALAAQPVPRVLILHSYHQGYSWTDQIDAAIKDSLAESDPRIDAISEYMDTKRVDPVLLFPYLHELYAIKYGRAELDVIIASDDNAFDFMKTHGADLFPGAALVFCGVNDFTPAKIEGWTKVTGVAENFDLTANLDLMLKIQPGLKIVAVVSDATETGAINLARLKRVTGSFEKRVSFVFLENMGAGELAESLQRLGPDAAVLDLGFWRDRNGRFFEVRESTEWLASNSPVPVYAPWDFVIVNGVLGGYAASASLQGREAGRLAGRVLKGEPAGSIPVVTANLDRPIFDFRALERFGILLSSLPAGSLVRSQPAAMSSWEFGGFLRSFVLVVLVLAGVVVLLLTGNMRIRRAENMWRFLFDGAADGILVHDMEGRILECNSTIQNRLGFTRAELLGRRIRDFNSPASLPGFDERLEAIRRDGAARVELEHLDRDGQVFPVESNARMIKFKGKPAILAVQRDLSERRLAARLIEKSLHEKEILLKEIHHRVKNNLQVISSLLSLQTPRLKDEEDRKFFLDTRNRVTSMALIHENLYRSDDFSRIDMADYLRNLVSHLSQSYLGDGDTVRSAVDCENVLLDMDAAIPCGLLVVELVSNSFKHAFNGGRSGTLRVELVEKDGELRLSVEDDGPGLPAGVDPFERDSLGYKLVDALSRQLAGRLELSSQGGFRTAVSFRRRC